MIASAFLLIALQVVYASPDCTLPTSTVKEGCAACWSYKFTEQITEQIVGYEEIDTVDQDQLEICSQTFGLPKDVILSFGRDFMCMICPAACTTETVPIKEQLVMATVCEVNATPIYEGCISCNETVFLVELPKDLPSDTICYWNIPQSTTTYTHLLQHNIFGVPPGGCKNTLVTIDSEGEKRVSCGDLSFASKVLKLTNERSQGSSIDVFYHKTDNRQDDELSILFVRMGAKEECLFTSKNISLSTDQQQTGAASLPTPCQCKELPEDIDVICPGIHQTNVFLQELEGFVNETKFNGSRYGYYGFQGCPGAEFFYPNGTFKNSTSMEECDQSRIGLSKAQADLFNVRKQELWNLLEESVNSNDLFCNGDDSDRPDAMELLYLERMFCPSYSSNSEDCNKTYPKANQVVNRDVCKALKASGTVDKLVWNLKL